MPFVSKVSIANANKIETLHNEWCIKNGYPVRWINSKVGRPNKKEVKNNVVTSN